MSAAAPRFETRLACGPDDLKAAQRLRYAVFVRELGGSGQMVDHPAALEADPFDAHSDHLLLSDLARPPGDQTVGVYRLMNAAQAKAAGGFYSASEYDLSPLIRSGRRVLELGRSCVHRDYRKGTALMHLWRGLAAHVIATDTELLFGVASFHGTDPDALAQPLSYLADQHLAPAALCPTALGAQAVSMRRIDPAHIDRKAALRDTPSLIKAYLRIGGQVGEGAFVDHHFNTTDVCMVLDVARMDAQQRAHYTGGA